MSVDAKSHRTSSREHSDKRERRRDRDDDRRRRSRSRERSHRDRDDRERRRVGAESRHRSGRDSERDRDRDRDRERDRDRDYERDRDRERRYRDERDHEDRRRKRDEDEPNDHDSRRSPSYNDAAEEPYNPEEVKEDDSEARSVFVSQLAARLTARDLGYFFEDKLGEGTVMDSRIVTDRLSRRSKGIGYVEFRSVDFVEKALNLSGTIVMGLPIMIQLTEAERNRLHAGDGNLNLPPGVTAPHGGAMQLYVGSLHFNLTESDIKQVFEPFGELEFVDLHRDPMTGRSKGYAFVQYKSSEDAKMALEQMDGFELAGRQLKVNTVHEKGTIRYSQQDSLDDSGGGNLNAASRQALMQKLARIEPAVPTPEPVSRPNIPQSMQSHSVLLKNMFDPEEETGRDWDKELAVEVKDECESKYGPVVAIKVEKESQGEIYVKFDSIEPAKKAIEGLNGRWFGGKQVSAVFISDAIMQAHQ
ncbi:splicing factor, CC1-like protein [Fistulina hepatica ATCC 64428]|uniref:Splicing factor, CC1-like protein n=1 Tax=Fistulina hepatica ATCC 64428 TaxID=1128425 RepID=A0A0D7AGQ0_9AGAR|nr:splicing factor, CC1-like protein [Fistulina hepatica ATCC 64428]